MTLKENIYKKHLISQSKMKHTKINFEIFGDSNNKIETKIIDNLSTEIEREFNSNILMKMIKKINLPLK